MKIISFLLPISLFVSTYAFAAQNAGAEFKNVDRSEIKLTIIDVTKEGVPTSIGFSKGSEVIVIGKVTANHDPVDISTGEVYDLTGPQSEGDVCSLSAKLSFVNGNLKIDFDQEQVGTAFFRLCTDLVEVEGTYQK